MIKSIAKWHINIFLKVFFKKINKKEYKLQIQLYNLNYQNINVLKNIIVVAKRDRKNKEFLAIKNIEKTAIVEVTKVLNAIN